MVNGSERQREGKAEIGGNSCPFKARCPQLSKARGGKHEAERWEIRSAAPCRRLDPSCSLLTELYLRKR